MRDDDLETCAAADDGDCCEDGGAAWASTAMLVAPRAAVGLLRLLWGRLALAWCRAAWWPLTRWARRQAPGSTARRLLAWAQRVAPWAFVAAVVPALTGGLCLPVNGGRLLERGQAFGGSRGLYTRCDPRPGESTVGVVGPRPKMRVRKDSAGRVVGWHMSRRDASPSR